MSTTENNILELQRTRDGRGKSFVGADLKGGKLTGARLAGADLTEADLSDADLAGADLTNANLTKAQVIGTDFTDATLTGACIENWNLSHTTNLDSVHCQYIYLLKGHKERRPNSGDFSEGEFSKFFQKSFGTIDFIFRGSIDWDAFVKAFRKIKVECGDADLTVQGIEDKGDGTFVIRVKVPEGTDKEEIHRQLYEVYCEQSLLNERFYLGLLKGKDEAIADLREHNIDMKEIIRALIRNQNRDVSWRVEIEGIKSCESRSENGIAPAEKEARQEASRLRNQEEQRPGMRKFMKPIKLFLSYSHKDEDLCRQLVNHLSGLERQGLIKVWRDHIIEAGKEWDREIDKHLNAADIILLLISSDFISSYYCHDIEMNRALERHAAGDARVIPVILRAVDWRGMPFSKLQALPAHGKPVKVWEDIDSAFEDVAQGIRMVIERVSQG